MKLYKPGVDFVPARVALYGPAKTGKSRLATALPWGPRWGERAIYVAADPGSEELGSVLEQNRERLIVVKPAPEQGNKYDPLGDAIKIATYDWKKDYPDVNTIIWDTVTETSRKLLAAYADSGAFSEKHVTFGKPGTLEYHAAPMEGDYGAAQRSTVFMLEYLDRQPLNKVLIFHDELVEPKENAVGMTFGGPALAGKAGTKIIAGRYDNLFKTHCKELFDSKGKATLEYRVYTAPFSFWLAGFRNPNKENPIPMLKMDSDPVNIWLAYEKAITGASNEPQKAEHQTA